MASSDANGARNVVANARNIYIHNYTKYTCIRIKSTVHNRITIFLFCDFSRKQVVSSNEWIENLFMQATYSKT